MRLDRGWILFPALSLFLAGCMGSKSPTAPLQSAVQPVVQPGTPDGGDDATQNNDDDVKALGDTFAGKIHSISKHTLHVGDLKILTDDHTDIGNQSGDRFGMSGLTVGNAVVLQIHVNDNHDVVATQITQVQDAGKLPLLNIRGRLSHVSDDRLTFEIAGILFHVNNTSHFGTGFDAFKQLDNGQIVRVRGKLRPNGDLTMRRVDLLGDNDTELPVAMEHRPH